MKQLHRIVLIDDDRADNFYHQIIIDEADVAEQVDVFDDARQALDFLRQNTDPIDIIFLDINMPRMNGFEFLAAFEQIEMAVQPRIIIVLTNSLNPKDINRASAHPKVLTCINKPLTQDTLTSLHSHLATIQ